ncbi:hypothetical protein GCM10012275_28890 [Longimycelium tulufanense]|uniref:Bacterial bifunctional deaminase-reductase C-terminal domain-containing protein n=1 Tax=Longimycelium tulufanense TaxID=907463 RepID=A0A8J3CG69_9PSEU|nr:pyrimidine reductase family protein [Longimycelium tulufanense]GGM55974.1 hypothetical protein GCM10012275_28890 [Longimycelium tulufanense]
MHSLWPIELISQPALDDAALERVYAYPEPLERPWVRVNFVSSLDGAVSVDGLSAGLSTKPDKRVFALLRDLCDVVLVGLGTALAEGYRGVKHTEVRAERRRRLGLSEVPPIAVVTRTCALSSDSPLVTDAVVKPVVLTCAAAPAERRQELAELGVDVVVAGTDDVEPAAALAALAERGLRRVLCEGGPAWFGTLIAADAVDELCLTLSPLLTSGDAGRIARGPAPATPLGLRLASVLYAADTLLLRYLRTTG